jgi:hypothetical protein
MVKDVQEKRLPWDVLTKSGLTTQTVIAASRSLSWMTIQEVLNIYQPR